MFGPMTMNPNIDRKPKEKWFFQDNFITGVFASQGYEGSHTGLVLPHNLPEDQRDLMLWAFEWGQHDGRQEGAEKLRHDMKRLLQID